MALLATVGPLLAPAAHSLAGVFAFLVARTEKLILAHPVRMRILARLSLLPGDHFRSVVRFLGVGMGAAEHHLRVLVDQGLVREERSNGRCRYYLAGAVEDLERNHLFAQHWVYRDVRARILLVLRREEEASPLLVARALGISRQLAAYHLARLVERGLATKSGGRYRA